MGHTVCLQSWTTVTGGAVTVVQNDSEWAEISAFKDVAVYTEVPVVAGTNVKLQIQTGPSREDLLFAGSLNAVGLSPYIVSYVFTGSPASAMQPIAVVRAATLTDGAPPSRYLRWRILFTGASDEITFRIYLNLNAGGR